MKGNNKVFGYIRVSTQKQGREGVSLEAQRDAITRYAHTHGLEVIEWIEDQESAAKQGRTGFSRMVGLLKRGKASGFICHKLDRSVRNIYDWSAIHQLVDSGFDIHFAQDGLDLHSLSGKLSADIQAAIAAHYSRNLRDEVRKGMVGRLKQGYLPFAAPRGYLNRGSAKPKEIDPLVGPLVRQLFELYSTGDYGFRELRLEMATRGLTTSDGKPLAMNNLTTILNNTFYYGVITVVRTGESYIGNHQPLISRALFDRCQDVLHKRIRRRSMRFDHAFRRRIRCGGCNRHLIGELQKGHVYYRCHSPVCKGVSLREEVIVSALRAAMFNLEPLAMFSDDIAERMREKAKANDAMQNLLRKQAMLQVDATNARLSSLLDMLLEGTIDKEAYLAKKRALINHLADLNQRVAQCTGSQLPYEDTVRLIVELRSALQALEKTADARETRMYADRVVSNLWVDGKTPCVSCVSPLPMLAEAIRMDPGAPPRDPHRTLEILLKALGLD